MAAGLLCVLILSACGTEDATGLADTGENAETTGSTAETPEVSDVLDESSAAPADTAPAVEIRETYAEKMYAEEGYTKIWGLVEEKRRENLWFNSSDVEPYTAEFREIADWESVLEGIPSTYYETYPEDTLIPDGAVLYMNGEETVIAADDPRLIRLMNFFDNTQYYVKYAWTQGCFPTERFNEIQSPDSGYIYMVITFEAQMWEQLLVYYTPNAYGGYLNGHGGTVLATPSRSCGCGEPIMATGVWPLELNLLNWLELFGFCE